jgi:hypothetical protein
MKVGGPIEVINGLYLSRKIQILSTHSTELPLPKWMVLWLSKRFAK